MRGRGSKPRRRRWLSVPALALAVTALGGGTVADAPAARADGGEPVERLGRGAWSYFGDPRAVFHAGAHRRTYVGWIDDAGSVRVASFDHDTREVTSAVVIARLGRDDHNNPSLLVRPDGRIQVFASAHAGRRMWFRISRRAEDVTAWGRLRALRTNTPGRRGYTYPNPIRLRAERRVYLFWRGGNFNPSFSISRNGTRWTRARTLVRKDRQRPYIKFGTDGRSRICFAFTEAHPSRLATSIYFACYRDGALHRADGTRIATVRELPIRPEHAERIYDGRVGGRTWVQDVAIDREGRPVVVYAQYPPGTYEPRYRYAIFTGGRWRDDEIVSARRPMADRRASYYPPGITLDHERPSVAYLSRYVDGTFEVERWSTRDEGSSWRRRRVSEGTPDRNVRPVAPRGFPGAEATVLWMSGPYPGYLAYGGSVMLRVQEPGGDNEIQRLSPGG